MGIVNSKTNCLKTNAQQNDNINTNAILKKLLITSFSLSLYIPVKISAFSK